jgi:hypothetical protein
MKLNSVFSIKNDAWLNYLPILVRFAIIDGTAPMESVADHYHRISLWQVARRKDVEV